MVLLKLIVAFYLSYVTLVTAKHAAELLVNLPNGGPVHGRYKTTVGGHGIRSFKNIPYAEAPVGNLRFVDPVPKAPWTGNLNNQHEVIMCPQEEHFFYQGMFMGREDCLYLNVYVPTSPKMREPLPVMIFFHGGGFASGSGTEALYGPDFLLEEDVILITVNYRLSVLGFLSTFTDEFPGNLGLKDQVLAMKWVQQNIAAFGGSPSRVTIFGESAGAGSVGYHLLSPMSKGLFQQAIMHSGSAYENWGNVSHAQSLNFAEKMFDVMGCEYTTGSYKATLDCMRKKDVKDLVLNMKEFVTLGKHPIVIFSPVKEEITAKAPFITEADYMKVDSGSNIPVMMGLTANEGAFLAAMLSANPTEMAQLEQKFDELIPSIVYLFDRFDAETMKQKMQMIRQKYFNGANFNWLLHKTEVIDFFSEITFFPGFIKTIKNRLATQMSANTFAYVFNYRGSASFTDLCLMNSEVEVNLGVSHIDDLLYLFPTVQNVLNFRIMSNEDNQMRKQMVRMWTNFAKTGNPSTKNVQWTPVQKLPIDYLRIGSCNAVVCNATGKTMSAMGTGFYDDRAPFWDEFYADKAAAPAKLEL